MLRSLGFRLQGLGSYALRFRLPGLKFVELRVEEQTKPQSHHPSKTHNSYSLRPYSSSNGLMEILNPAPIHMAPKIREPNAP